MYYDTVFQYMIVNCKNIEANICSKFLHIFWYREILKILLISVQFSFCLKIFLLLEKVIWAKWAAFIIFLQITIDRLRRFIHLATKINKRSNLNDRESSVLTPSLEWECFKNMFRQNSPKKRIFRLKKN